MLNSHEYSGKTKIWLDVERRAWDTDLVKNRQVVIDMMSVNLPENFEFGIYSNYLNWQDIVGLDWDYPSMRGLPLWYAHYDNKADFSDFESFGGWTTPFMKQFQGTHTNCDMGIDYDWFPNEADSFMQ